MKGERKDSARHMTAAQWEAREAQCRKASRDWQLKRRAEGKCTQCAEPRGASTNKNLCERCAEKARSAVEKRRAKYGQIDYRSGKHTD